MRAWKVIRLDCSCCTVRVRERANTNERSVYEFNGVEYVGMKALAEALGIKLDVLRRRLQRRYCLQVAVAVRPGREADGSSVILARQFCLVMARTMGGA